MPFAHNVLRKFKTLLEIKTGHLVLTSKNHNGAIPKHSQAINWRTTAEICVTVGICEKESKCADKYDIYAPQLIVFWYLKCVHALIFNDVPCSSERATNTFFILNITGI